VKTRKGRGFEAGPSREVISDFESIKPSTEDKEESQAQRSIEGYILMVTGIHEEAHEVMNRIKYV